MLAVTTLLRNSGALLSVDELILYVDNRVLISLAVWRTFMRILAWVCIRPFSTLDHV